MTTICCLIALTCLTGCDGANPFSSVPKGPVPVSEALKEKRVWIEIWGDSQDISKDMNVVSVWDFDGNGNVTVYMSDLGSMVLKKDQAVKLKDLKGMNNEQIVSYIKEKFGKDYKGDGEYNPQPEPYELRVNTDGSGNNTATETIKSKGIELNGYNKYKIEDQYIHLGKSASGAIYDVNYCGFMCASVKKGSYFITACEPNFPGFELDTPKTKGVEVN